MRRRLVPGAVAGLLMVLGLVSCTPPSALPRPSAAPQPAISPGTAGTVELGDRPFQLRVPTGYDPVRPTALVVALHGYTSNATEALGFFGLAGPADERGLLVALPEGSENARGDQFWNASSACCDFDRGGVDDVAYLTGVIEAVQRSYAVDRGRVFVVGHSNGGFMALRLACDRADRVAAVASVAGAMDLVPGCAPSRPISVLQVHGSADQTILPAGGRINGVGYTSVEATLELWRNRDGCPATPTAVEEGGDADSSVAGDDLVQTSWSDCAEGAEVALWTITGGGHVPALTPEFTGDLLDWLDANARG